MDVLPGINEVELSEIEHKLDLVDGLVKWVQIDFADGVFTPAHTFLDIAKFAPLIAAHPTISFEAHLMVEHPEKLIKPLVDVGFKRIIAHVEVNEPRLFLDDAEYESVEVGLAIDGPTELEQVEPMLEHLDVVLVLMAEAGESGQELQQENVEKIRAIKDHYPDLPIEVDIGIDDKTAKVVKDAGATRVVSTSYLFQSDKDIESRIETLEQI